MVVFAMIALGSLATLPRVAVGEARILEHSRSTFRVQWNPDARAPVDPSFAVALPPGMEVAGIEIESVESRLGHHDATPVDDDCEFRREFARRALERELVPESAIAEAMSACRPGEPLGDSPLVVRPAIETSGGSLLPLRVTEYRVAGESRVPRSLTIRVRLRQKPASAAPVHARSASSLPNFPPLDVAVSANRRVRIVKESLAALWPDPIPVAGLALVSRAGPVAITVSDANADGLLGPGEWIEFYGEAGRNRYDRRTVYRLSVLSAGDPAILRMIALPPPAGPGNAAPVAARGSFRKKLRYVISILNGDADNFYWSLLSAPNASSTGFSLPGATSSAPAGSVSVVLQGLTTIPAISPDHHGVVAINGATLGDAFFDGQQEITATFAIPAGVLAATGNTLTLSLPGDTGATSDFVLLRSFSVDYARDLAPAVSESSVAVSVPENQVLAVGPFPSPSLVALDVTDPRTPRREEVTLGPDGSGGFQGTAGGFGSSATPITLDLSVNAMAPDSMAPARGLSLLADFSGADLLIVSPPEFLSAAQTLADRRTSQGLRVRILRTDDVYGAFSGGELDPSAVRSLVLSAVANWTPPAPRFVLLLGDGSFDYQRDLGGATDFDNGNFVPVALFDSEFNETASDNYFVDLDGDLFPELAIGRIPAASLTEATTVVQKILDYEDRPFGVGFETRAIFVGDAPVTSSDTYYFEQLPLELAADLPGYMHTSQLQLSGMTAAAMTQAIVDGVNQGAVWVDYIGHGSVRSWSQSQILSTTTVPSLTNADRPSFFLTMTCSNGLFQFPNTGPTGASQRSLAEAAFLSSTGGAIGFLAPSNSTLPEPLPALNHKVLQVAFDGKVERLGDLVRQAKLASDFTVPGTADLVRGLILFGDPSMSLRNNHDPFAVIAPLASLPTGGWIDVDGSGSFDLDGQPLGYRWRFLSVPPGSLAPVRQANDPIGQIWADLAGEYVLSLEVDDGLVKSSTTVLLTAAGPPSPPPRSRGCGCRLEPTSSAGRGVGPLLMALAIFLFVRRRRAERA